MTDLDPGRLKSEILDYLRQTGQPIFYSNGSPNEAGYTYWDTRNYPDWRQFIDAGREAGVGLLLFSSLTFDADDLEMVLNRIDELEAPKEERDHYRRQLEPLRRQIGQVAWVRMAYHYQGRWLAYERLASWYADYRDVMEEIDALFPEFEEADQEDEDDDRGPGFFSPN